MGIFYSVSGQASQEYSATGPGVTLVGSEILGVRVSFQLRLLPPCTRYSLLLLQDGVRKTSAALSLATLALFEDASQTRFLKHLAPALALAHLLSSQLVGASPEALAQSRR